MAILPSLPGITVSILSATGPDDPSPTPLTEYAEETPYPSIPPYQQVKTTSSFIQATGLNFQFQLRVGPPYLHDCDVLGFWFILNGIDDGPAQLCSPDHLNEEGCWERVVPGWEIVDEEGRMGLRRFQWTELVKNEENPDHNTKEENDEMKKVGTIEVKVYRMKQTQTVKPKAKKVKNAIKEVPEKLFKGQSVSLSIGLGDAEEIDEETLYQSTKLVDGEEHPIAIFRFKYRSKEDLQSEFIIPRTPSPSPPPPPTFADLSAEEITELARSGHIKKEVSRRLALRMQRNPKPFVPKPFESLSEAEKMCLARGEWADSTGEEMVKVEEEVVRISEGMGAKRKYSEGRTEGGQVLIDLLDDDDDEVADVASGSGVGVVDDEVAIVEVRRVKRVRGQGEGGQRVKTESGEQGQSKNVSGKIAL